MALTKTELIKQLAEKSGITKKQAGAVLENLVALAYKHAKEGFVIPGLGKLVVKQRAARKGRNPKTGEIIDIPAKRVLKFRIAKAAKDAVLGKKK